MTYGDYGGGDAVNAQMSGVTPPFDLNMWAPQINEQISGGEITHHGKLVDIIDPKEDFRFPKSTGFLLGLLNKLKKKTINSVKHGYQYGEHIPSMFEVTFAGAESLAPGGTINIPIPAAMRGSMLLDTTFAIPCSTTTKTDANGNSLYMTDVRTTAIAPGGTSITVELNDPTETATFAWAAGNFMMARTGNAQILGGYSVEGYEEQDSEVWNFQQMMKFGYGTEWNGAPNMNYRKGSAWANLWQRKAQMVWARYMRQKHNCFLLQQGGWAGTEANPVPVTRGILDFLTDNRWYITERPTEAHMDKLLQIPMEDSDQQDGMPFIYCSNSLKQALTYGAMDKSWVEQGTSVVKGMPVDTFISPMYGPVPLVTTTMLRNVLLPLHSTIVGDPTSYRGNSMFILNSANLTETVFPGYSAQEQSNLQPNDQDAEKKQLIWMGGLEVRRPKGMVVATFKSDASMKMANVKHVGAGSETVAPI